MVRRCAASWWIVGAAALAATAAQLAGCSSGEKPKEKAEPIEISEAEQRVNPDTDPLDGGETDNASATAEEPAQPDAGPAAARVERVTLTGGLVVEDVREGQGPMLLASEGVTVTVHYVGRIVEEEGVEGRIFDSTYERGEPLTLELDRLIRGWRQGLPGMRIGGLRRLTIPPDLAYGAEGHLNVPGGATVVYEVLLLGFSPQRN